MEATEGWYGTLPEGRTTAFRDDTTVHVRSGAAAATPAKPIAAPAPSTPAAKTPAAAPTYTPYTYPSNYQNSQYRGGYGTYTPAATSTSYYPNYTTPTAQAGTASHYPNAQYVGAQQSGYTYSPWYYQNQAGSTSGRATPQPAAAAPATPAPAAAAGANANYAGYYGVASAQASPAQRAVANTVAKPYQAPAWTGAPTLPPHMRSAVAAAASPGTPPPATGAAAPDGYAGYYGGYQAPR